jgi:ATP-binding cassette subfamily C protein LapB
LVYGSVKDNIVIGWPQADDEAVLRAATVAGVDDFVKARPQGYDLPVGERGQYLSGGQRAAVTIARALLDDPPILLLDEPTGSMDNTSEQRFKGRLQQILPGKTLILVTHRGSMLSLVDRLIVVDQGRVVADGPKQKVLEDLAAGAIRGSSARSGA